mmetsp:Transcript_24489/g.35110  ORF Transcript_24489/g.35110 Transcript_24489/m.35110 type:complete len:203 (-) Transcript_24489:83-691(-)
MTNTTSTRKTTSNSSHLLHPSVTSALDALVDRWNNNLWNTTTTAATGSTATSTTLNTTTTKNTNSNKIHAILLGTSDGIGLARSFGSTTAAGSRTLSDDVLTGIETTWAALPSNNTISAGHYLQQPLGMGNIRIVTAFYETVVLIHLHFSPLIITFLCDPSSNIGAIRATFPNLFKVLEPLRAAIDSQQQTTTTYYKSKSKS